MSGRPALDCEAVRDLAGLYALGALEPGEAEAIREHVAGCTVGHPELDADTAIATALLETVEPVEPPAGLRTRLLAAAQADLREGRHPSTARATTADEARGLAPIAAGEARGLAAGEAVAAPAPAAGVVSLDAERARRRFRWASLAAAAAVIVAVALGGWNVALRSQLDQAEAYRTAVAEALKEAALPGSSVAFLASTEGTPTGLAVVGSDHAVRIALRGLTPTSGSSVYTLWAIGPGSSTPVNIGEFRTLADGTAAGVTPGPGPVPGSTLALTLEPAPGATAPTTPVLASGTTRVTSG